MFRQESSDRFLLDDDSYRARFSFARPGPLERGRAVLEDRDVFQSFVDVISCSLPANSAKDMATKALRLSSFVRPEPLLPRISILHRGSHFEDR